MDQSRSQVPIAGTRPSRARALAVIHNEYGMITLDFIFAFTVAISVMMVLFAVTVTFAMVEVAQYVTYTTSRAYAGAHDTPGMQADLGNARYKEVMALSAIKTFLTGDWVAVGKPTLQDFSDEYPETEATNHVFVGAQITFNAHLLHLNVPFFGQTATDSGVGQATLNSYLMREVSTQECRENFTKKRFENLKQIGPYSAAPAAEEALITDNGC